MKKFKFILPIAAFTIAIASAFTTANADDLLLSPFGTNPLSVPANQCQSGTISNDPSGTCQTAESRAVVCKITFTAGGSSFDADAKDGSCTGTLITRNN